MIDPDRKNSILDAEREFERKELLSQALATRGVTLIGKITSAAPKPEPEPSDAPDEPV